MWDHILQRAVNAGGASALPAPPCDSPAANRFGLCGGPSLFVLFSPSFSSSAFLLLSSGEPYRGYRCGAAYCVWARTWLGSVVGVVEMSRTTRETEKQTLAMQMKCATRKAPKKQKSHVPGGIRTHAPCEIGALIQRLRPTRPRKLMHDNCIECSVSIRARLSHRQCVVFCSGLCVSDRVTDWGQGFSNSACCSRGYIARFPASSSNARFNTARVQRDRLTAFTSKLSIPRSPPSSLSTSRRPFAKFCPSLSTPQESDGVRG